MVPFLPLFHAKMFQRDKFVPIKASTNMRFQPFIERERFVRF
jgi:hypothetical protein